MEDSAFWQQKDGNKIVVCAFNFSVSPKKKKSYSKRLSITKKNYCWTRRNFTKTQELDSQHPLFFMLHKSDPGQTTKYVLLLVNTWVWEYIKSGWKLEGNDCVGKIKLPGDTANAILSSIRFCIEICYTSFLHIYLKIMREAFNFRYAQLRKSYWNFISWKIETWKSVNLMHFVLQE